MAGFAKQPTDAALGAIAGRGETAAAGVACALACATAAALVELTASLAADRVESATPDEAAQLRKLSERAGEVRAGALADADADVGAYARVRGAPGELERVTALKQAGGPPTRIAESAAEVAAAAAEVAGAGSWPFTPDARVAAELAAAAARGAADLVAANLGDGGDDPTVSRARAAADRATTAAARATAGR
jgi:formiminotetrahydrofolate cyclodeaminase